MLYQAELLSGTLRGGYIALPLPARKEAQYVRSTAKSTASSNAALTGLGGKI